MTRRRKKTPAASAPRVADHRFQRLGGGSLLVAMTFLAYLPALQGGYVMDDNYYVTDQPVNWSLDGLRRIWLEPRSTPQYYPLLHTSFWLQYQLWQDSPLGYHAVNLLLFACTVVLAWRVLLRLQVPGAWLAAAIFAVHPVCVESVAWVTKLMNLQSMLLALGAMGFYLQFEPPAVVDNVRRSPPRRYYWLSLGLFLLALLSKTVVASLPAVLLVVYWWKRGTIGWRDVRPLLPFFALALVLGSTTAWLERSQAGAEGPDWSFTFIERCLIAGRAVWFYAGKLVWPYPLLFYYPRWDIDPAVWWQWLYPLGMLAVVATLWLLRHRIGRGPLAGVLIYVGVLFPALGFFNVYAFRYSFVADHYQFHAMLALIALAAAGWEAWHRGAKPNVRAIAVAAPIFVLAIFAALSWLQNLLYTDPIMLYRATLQKSPESWVAHNNLGNALARISRIPEAIDHYEQALRLRPDYVEAHYNLGNSLARQERWPEAIAHFQQALLLKPQYAEAKRNLRAALQDFDNSRKSIKVHQESLSTRSDAPWVYANLGRALMAAARSQEAIQQFEQALQVKPDVPDVVFELAKAYAQLNRSAEAVATAQKALDLARSSSDVRLAERIEIWLNSYYASQKSNPESFPPREATTP